MIDMEWSEISWAFFTISWVGFLIFYFMDYYRRDDD